MSHWISGSVPRPEVRPAITEAFSLLLARPVTCAEIGWPPAPGGGQDVAAEVTDLSQVDMAPSRRGVLKSNGMYAAVLVIPRFEDMTERLDAVAAGRAVRISRSDVETVRTMTDRVADILDQVGAGHARPMAAAFLANTAGPHLRAAGTSETVRGMRAAVADFVYLTGWMAMYENEREGVSAKEIASGLGLESVPAEIEGVRSQAGRLAERGWLAVSPSGRTVHTAAAHRVCFCRHREAERARRRLMSMAGEK